MLHEQQQRILGYFIEESKDHLNTIEQGLLNLQSTLDDSEMINEVFRAAHSIKGGAAMLGLSSIQQTSHRLEDCFKVLKEHPIRVDQKLESLFLGVSDTLKALLEQLEGPLGLSEETANALMAEAEPVFKWLHEYLEVLVKQGNAEVATSTPIVVAVTINESERRQHIQTQVIQTLREMLQIFKQTATPETRQNLQECCYHLVRLGEELNWSHWCRLCSLAGSAIANPDNTYLTLAKIVITEIKQALELVLAGRQTEIVINQPLESLIKIQEIELLEISIDSVDASEENVLTMTSASNLVGSANILDVHDEIPQTISHIVEVSENIDIEIQAQDRITTLSELSDKLNYYVDNTPAKTSSFDSYEPEVGVAELNSLADLFEGEISELDGSWEHVEILDISSIDKIKIDLKNSKDEDVDSEFKFLFEDQKSQITAKEEATIMQLFGEELLEEEKETQNRENPSNIEQKKFTQLQPETNANIELSIKFESSFDDLFQETTNVDVTQHNTLSADTELESPIPHLDEIFLQDLFKDEILSLPDLLPETAELSPISVSESSDDLSSAQSQVGALLDLFAQTEEELSPIPVSKSSDDLLSAQSQAATFSRQEDDLSSFWEHRTEEGEFNPKVEQDAAKALEEILFAAAASDDIFSNDREPILSNSASLNLENLEIDFQLEEQFDLLFPLETEDELFKELAPNNSTISTVDNEINSQQQGWLLNSGNPSTTQAPEVLDFTPEFTNLLGDNSVDSLPLPSLEVQDSQKGDYKLSESIEDTDIWSDNPFWFHTLEVESDETLPVLLEDLPTTRLNDIELDSIDNLFTVQSLVENSLPILEDVLAEEMTLPDEERPESTLVKSAQAIEESTVLEDSIKDFQELLDTQSELESLEAAISPIEAQIIENEMAVLSYIREQAAETELEELIDGASVADEFAELDELLKQEAALSAMPQQEIAATEELLLGVSKVPLNAASLDSQNHFQELEPMVKGDLARPPVTRTLRFEQLMKVPVKHFDDLSNLVGELVVNRNTLEQDQERLRQSLDNLLSQVQQLSDVGSRMQELYERSLLEASLLASRKNTGFGSNSDKDRGFSELEMDRFTPFHSLSQEMIEMIVRVRESASDIDFVTEETERVARQFRQVTTQLQEGITRSRMEPFTEIITPLERGVREGAIRCGKQAKLVIEGQDSLIDKMILEHLKNPLMHLLNNAIAHGIETPEERQASSKPAMGVITVRAFHQGNQTIISVGDDGAGIDLEGVKAKAINRGIMTLEQAKMMSVVEVYNLLFQAGFSTKDQADDLAGRGVGLDVVRTRISEIRGTITIDSTVGKGTTFTIRLPLTLSICKALCCVSDKARIAFPMDGVEDTLDIHVKNVQQIADGRKLIPWRDTLLPLQPLKELLTLNRQLSRGSVYGGNRDDDMISVVVVRSANTLIALQVDQVLNEQEIAIKQFEGPAPKPVGVAGATVLGDGRIMPIADVLEILDIFQGRISKQPGVIWDSKVTSITPDIPPVKIEPTVLIIDDSITVRELLSITFNKAGYRVEQARDGQEAWDKLRSGLPCDIVFCDIEMPRCDGLELLSRIRKDSNLNHLPIAMLTSRGADKHRQMAIQLGASGYFTKPYLEEALLEAAGRMVKGEKLVVPLTGSN
ncbi:MAG: response regulator [Rhizonema sp. PD37]|nr:response regulator [Rhizonema sp. PD37]